MKTMELETIQTLAKIGRVLSKIVYICCIIGVAGCVVGMVSLPFADTGVLKIGGMSIHGLIANRSGMEPRGLYPLMTGAMIVCIGQGITAAFAQHYFKCELAAGTPFTLDGARELLRLGILTVCVPLGALILAQIASAIVTELVGCGETFKLDGIDSVALGLTFMVMSLLCRHGAEREAQAGTEVSAHEVRE